MIVESQFNIGDIVIHTKYHFRAVVVDVEYNVPDSENYETIKSALDYNDGFEDTVWYKLLIDNGEDLNFVPEIMLSSDTTAQPVSHPLLNKYLKSNVENGTYKIGASVN